MANSIQPLLGTMLFPPSMQMVGEDSAAALAFGHAVDAVPTMSPDPDIAVKLVNIATLDHTISAVPVQALVPEPLTANTIISFLPSAQIHAGDTAMSAVMPPNDAPDADGQKGSLDPEASTEGLETPSLSSAVINDIPFTFFALPPTSTEQLSLKADLQTRAAASPVPAMASDASLPAPFAVGPTSPLDAFVAPHAQERKTLMATVADTQSLTAKVPDNTRSASQNEPAQSPPATDAKSAVPSSNAVAALAELPPTVSQKQTGAATGTDPLPPAPMDAPGQAGRGPMAAMFAAVPQLAPRLVQAPGTGRAALTDAAPQIKEQVLPAPAPAVAAPTPIQPAPAPAAANPALVGSPPAVDGPMTPDPAQVSGPPETDALHVFTPDPGLSSFSDAKAALSAPPAVGVPDRGLLASHQPVPIADLPQIVARLASSENAQPKGLQLDPIELGTVAFNMETGAAGLVVTITAERPETLDLLRRHADQFLADLRQSGFQGASLQFSQSGNGQMGQGQPGQGQGQFGQGNNGNPQPQGHTNPDYGTSTQLFEKQPNVARPTMAGTLNLRL